MKINFTVTDVVELINQIRHEPESFFELNCAKIQETVGQYLSNLMDVELTKFLGRGRRE